MRAVVVHNPRNVTVETVPDPHVSHPRDAIVRVTSTAICADDLRSAVPGHELVGTVEALGAAVKNLSRGDRVVATATIACGVCWYCERGFSQHCASPRPRSVGHAQLVRIPFADFGLRRLPASVTDTEALLLCRALPTAYAGLRHAQLQPGETVVVWGCGPLGTMAMRLARAMGAVQVIGVDVLPYRLDVARRSGAIAVDPSRSDAVETVRQLAGGRGADVGIVAVGPRPEAGIRDRISTALHWQHLEEPVEQTLAAVRPAGRVSLLGAQGALPSMFDKGIRVSGGPAPVHALIDELMEMVRTGRVKVDDVVTHRLPLERAPHAYEVYARRLEGCEKVALDPWTG